MSGCGNGEEEKESEFKYGDVERERFNRIFKYYEGIYNFYNFIIRIKVEDLFVKWYIVLF